MVRSGDGETTTMQYALLIYEPAESYADGEAGQAWQDILNAHNAFGGELAQSGAMRGGAGLKSTDTATTVRVSADGRTVHDGPFAETREQLGGYYLIEAADLDEACAIAARVPSARFGSIEVRPIVKM